MIQVHSILFHFIPFHSIPPRSTLFSHVIPHSTSFYSLHMELLHLAAIERHLLGVVAGALSKGFAPPECSDPSVIAQRSPGNPPAIPSALRLGRSPATRSMASTLGECLGPVLHRSITRFNCWSHCRSSTRPRRYLQPGANDRNH